MISGPGIEGQVEVKDKQALAIFRLGYLKACKRPWWRRYRPAQAISWCVISLAARSITAQLTYYPNPERGPRLSLLG